MGVITLTLITAGLLVPGSAPRSGGSSPPASPSRWAPIEHWGVAGRLVLGAGIYAASRRDPVTALNVNDVPVPPLAQTAA